MINTTGFKRSGLRGLQAFGWPLPSVMRPVNRGEPGESTLTKKEKKVRKRKARLAAKSRKRNR